MGRNKILNQIYKYYPKNVSFNSKEYQNSPEYQRQMQKRKTAYNDLKYKQYLEKKLEKIFKGFAVRDWTDLESYNCYEYRILLHKNQEICDDDTDLIICLGNERSDIFLFISILEKYYYLTINKTKYTPLNKKWNFENTDEDTEYFENEVKNLRNFLQDENYTELSGKTAKTIIDNIETELKEAGDTKVFDCLFTDLTAI